MRTLFLILTLWQALCVTAQETPNAKQARRIFDETYKLVLGEQGSTLSYDVNIVGIYKTQGTIWFKGTKQRFHDERVDTWNDGKTAYMAFRKKKTVEIHTANSDKKDKYSGKFKFSPEDFTYSISEDPEGLLLTLKQKKKAKGTIKEARVLVKRKTYEPIRLRVKVAFIWTTVKISNFRSGGISDDIFVFPQSKYGDWKFVDKRNP